MEQNPEVNHQEQNRTKKELDRDSPRVQKNSKDNVDRVCSRMKSRFNSFELLISLLFIYLLHVQLYTTYGPIYYQYTYILQRTMYLSTCTADIIYTCAAVCTYTASNATYYLYIYYLYVYYHILPIYQLLTTYILPMHILHATYILAIHYSYSAYIQIYYTYITQILPYTTYMIATYLLLIYYQCTTYILSICYLYTTEMVPMYCPYTYVLALYYLDSTYTLCLYTTSPSGDSSPSQGDGLATLGMFF